MSIPWDSGLGDAFQQYIRTFQSFEPGIDSYSQIELSKIAIADALLSAIGAPTSFERPEYHEQPREKPNTTQGNIRNRKKWGCSCVARVMQKFGAYCQRCACEDNLVLDHVVPLSKGGLDSEENLQPLCWGCNAKKGCQL